MNIPQIISEELKVTKNQVTATIELIETGATVPFIARYRKEVTGGLDDKQLRDLSERLTYLTELAERKVIVLKSIEEQGKLTDEITEQVESFLTKSALEDFYLPYKPKRRTKSQIAIEAGLQPLALSLLEDQNQDPEILAKEYLNPEKGIDSESQALDGAKHILMDLLSESPEVTQYCRDIIWQHGLINSRVIEESKEGAEKFKDYFEYDEKISTIPSHRILALFRGRQLDFLRLKIELDDYYKNECKQYIAQHFNIAERGFLASNWLWQCVEWAWDIKLFLRLEMEAYTKLRESAEEQAVDVFAENLNNLLMAAPAGAKVTMGLDPGYRTGVKVVVVDKTGKLLAHSAIFPHAPQNQWQKSLHELGLLCKKYQVELISIGNGTASRETDRLAIELIKNNPELKLTKLVVSEAGASVYSASELAAEEFPNLDVVYRGAVSIARRLQDPLAELVKIEPKAIGVGQYQHDVNQYLLARNLDNTVEDCVNRVGVDVNTASVQLLTRVSGLNQSLARNIVAYRDQNGSFINREQLKKVDRMGDKTYQQCAGFLRITTGDNPLDSSSVHPETYPIVENILGKNNIKFKELIGNAKLLNKLNPQEYISDNFGVITVKDIINELFKPGRDPRPEFTTAEFKEGVETINDLSQGMSLEGVVTNVTPFGAFVDIGVHQDGLVHISRLADKFISNPNEVVKVGQVVKVKVLEVDAKRKRISLSMKQNETTKVSSAKKDSDQPLNTAMANAFSEALKNLRS